MENLQKHRLNSLSEIDDLMAKIGEHKFQEYQDGVFAVLKKLNMGDVFDIPKKVKSENQSVFVKCCCLYIIRTGGDCNIVFTENYTAVKGIQTFNEMKAEEMEILKTREKMKSRMYKTESSN